MRALYKGLHANKTAHLDSVTIEAKSTSVQATDYSKDVISTIVQQYYVTCFMPRTDRKERKLKRFHVAKHWAHWLDPLFAQDISPEGCVLQVTAGS